MCVGALNNFSGKGAIGEHLVSVPAIDGDETSVRMFRWWQWQPGGPCDSPLLVPRKNREKSLSVWCRIF